MQREVASWVKFALVIIAVVFIGAVMRIKGSKQDVPQDTPRALQPEDEKTVAPSPTLSPSPDTTSTPTPSDNPVIPTSSVSAKEYLERASQAAQANNYKQAISILEEGIKKFPDDQNLKLTKEYYEIEAQRNGQ